jgi:hypothetical protein
VFFFEHTPQHLYDVDGPCFGFVESSWSCSGGGDWGDCDHDSSEAAAAWPFSAAFSLPWWVGGHPVFFWRAHALRGHSAVFFLLSSGNSHRSQW